MARCGAVRLVEAAGEVGRVGEAPGSGNGLDRAVGVFGHGQVAACAFQTSANDPLLQAETTLLTQPVQSRFDIPTFIAHGDDDQIVPIVAAGLKSAELVKDATLKAYPGAPHGLVGVFKDEFNADLLAFLAS